MAGQRVTGGCGHRTAFGPTPFPCALPATPWRQRAVRQPSYLNDNCSRVRYASTLPPSILTSSLVTSATRRSRSDLPAVSTASARSVFPRCITAADDVDHAIDAFGRRCFFGHGSSPRSGVIWIEALPLEPGRAFARPAGGHPHDTHLAALGQQRPKAAAAAGRRQVRPRPKWQTAASIRCSMRVPFATARADETTIRRLRISRAGRCVPTASSRPTNGCPRRRRSRSACSTSSRCSAQRCSRRC